VADPTSASAADTVSAPVARSAIRAALPVAVVDGWEVSARRSSAALRLADLSSLAKTLVRASRDGPVAAHLGVGFGRAQRDATGRLVVGSGPDEWTVIGPVGSGGALHAELDRIRDGGLVTVIDLTHGQALVRLRGGPSAAVLGKLCAIDTSQRVTPDGAAFRSYVANVVTDVVRDDLGGQRSYLLHCERSLGQYLFDAVLDAGREFGVEVAGLAPDDL
jgi:heterotetrameric sarcosine oxidase gamma subunit